MGTFDEDVLFSLSELIGEEICKINRIVYQFDGEIEKWNEGDVELIFESGNFVRFSDTRGGQKLVVSDTAWVDELAETDKDVEDYIDRFGKWTRRDVTNRAPYKEIVGEKIRDITLYERSEGLGGTEMKINGNVISIFAAADQCRVEFSAISDRLDELYLRESSYQL